MSRAPVPAVGVVCLRGDEVLLIRRGRPPLQGGWSLPGGRVEWGERVEAAALRELAEETGVRAELDGLVAVVDGLFLDEDRHYVLLDYLARWTAGEPTSGDDAADARFFPIAEVGALGLWPRTEQVIREAVALAARPRAPGDAA